MSIERWTKKNAKVREDLNIYRRACRLLSEAGGPG